MPINKAAIMKQKFHKLVFILEVEISGVIGDPWWLQVINMSEFILQFERFLDTVLSKYFHLWRKFNLYLSFAPCVLMICKSNFFFF
jgi:hypothetical protein